MTSVRTAFDPTGLVVSPTAHTALVPVDGEAIVVDESRGYLHLLNPEAALVWSLFDGVSTIGEISDDLADALGVPAAVVAADVGALVRRLLDDDLLVAPGYVRPVLPDELGACDCGEAHGPEDVDRIEIAGNP